MKSETEQERAGWENPYPLDGEQCPECRHGLIETQEFGRGKSEEIVAWCAGLNGIKREDADESEWYNCGCGWEGLYYPNETN